MGFLAKFVLCHGLFKKVHFEANYQKQQNRTIISISIFFLENSKLGLKSRKSGFLRVIKDIYSLFFEYGPRSRRKGGSKMKPVKIWNKFLAFLTFLTKINIFFKRSDYHKTSTERMLLEPLNFLCNVLQKYITHG